MHLTTFVDRKPAKKDTTYRYNYRHRGIAVTFDSVEEAKACGVARIVKEAEVHRRGDWYVRRSDGKVCRATAQFIIDKILPEEQSVRRTPDSINRDVVTPNKIRMAEEWLMGGVPLEEAFMNCVGRGFVMTHLMDKRLTIRVIAYWFLAGAWFDRVISENRILRDRYMNLVRAFEKEGIDDAYLAKKFKQMADSGTERERINAVNKITEIIVAFEGKNRLPEQAGELDTSVEEATRLAQQKLLTPAVEKKIDREVERILSETESEVRVAAE